MELNAAAAPALWFACVVGDLADVASVAAVVAVVVVVVGVGVVVIKGWR